MPSQTHYKKLENLRSISPYHKNLDTTIEIGEGTATVRLKITPDLLHGAGIAHGAVLFMVMDDATAFAASSLVEDTFLVTVSFNIYFTRPVSDGEMIATANVVHQSKRLLIADVDVVNEDGKQLGRGSGTFMPSNIPLSAAVGYTL
ncbi:MAG: PaaI family thioesterase [Chloroflexota bacterium]